MPYTLAVNKLPFRPDRNQIIYVDGSNNTEVDSLIKYNYFGIRRCFESRGYDFCYIPYLKEELENYEKVHYNAPYAKSGHAKLITDDNFILNFIAEPKKREEISPSLLYYIPHFEDEDIPKAQYIFRCIPIKESTFEEDSVLRKVLNEILKDIEENDSQILYSSPDDWIPYIPRDGEVETADDKFDYESLVLMREIEERIKKLREKGIKQYVIERLVRNNKRLSKLTITKNNKIFLHEYFIEINMTPLPKALYFLFLNHPEGIMFSYLPDFREELLEIYKKIKGPLYKESEARKSIWDLTDPLGNSINEKCSRIREAFVSQFDEHLACNYCITGIRGEAKKIILPRDLVIWEE